MNVSRSNQSKIFLVAIVSGALVIGGVGTSVYLAIRPASQNPVTSAGEPTPTFFELPTRRTIPTATPVTIPSELPTIFKTFDPKVIPSPTPTPPFPRPKNDSEGTETAGGPEPTLSEDQKQEAVKALDKLDGMPEEFKNEFLEWLNDI